MSGFGLAPIKKQGEPKQYDPGCGPCADEVIEERREIYISKTELLEMVKGAWFEGESPEGLTDTLWLEMDPRTGI